jgi:3-isopropylmalate dehydratase small subunit
MEDIDKSFAQEVQSGDIIVAGENFGCGSSREHAPIAIKASGVSCIIAASFARIFFRNSINIGLPLFEHPEAAHDAKKGDRIRVDLNTGEIQNLTQQKSYHVTPLPPFIQNIIQAGGLMPYVKNQLDD